MSLSIFISPRPSSCFAFLHMSVFKARWETRWRVGEGVCEMFWSFFKFLRVPSLHCVTSVFSDWTRREKWRRKSPKQHLFHGTNPFDVYSPFLTSDPRSYPIHEVSQFEYLGLILDLVRHRSRTRVASLIWGFFIFASLHPIFPIFFEIGHPIFSIFFHFFSDRTKFSASPRQRDPEYCSFKLIFTPDLRSDNECSPISETEKNEGEKETDSSKRGQKRTNSEELWSDSCGARRLWG